MYLEIAALFPAVDARAAGAGADVESIFSKYPPMHDCVHISFCKKTAMYEFVELYEMETSGST